MSLSYTISKEHDIFKANMQLPILQTPFANRLAGGNSKRKHNTLTEGKHSYLLGHTVMIRGTSSWSGVRVSPVSTRGQASDARLVLTDEVTLNPGVQCPVIKRLDRTIPQAN